MLLPAPHQPARWARCRQGETALVTECRPTESAEVCPALVYHLPCYFNINLG